MAPPELPWVTQLQELADQTGEGVRRPCRDLYPAILDDLGLRAALAWLAESWGARGPACTFESSGQERRLDPEVEIELFRIAQEALSNSWKHSRARQVSLQLHYLSEGIQVRIRDDGQGFATHRSTRMGLVNMRERALLIGADLIITSAPHQGCSVALSWQQEG